MSIHRVEKHDRPNKRSSPSCLTPPINTNESALKKPRIPTDRLSASPETLSPSSTSKEWQEIFELVAQGALTPESSIRVQSQSPSLTPRSVQREFDAIAALLDDEDHHIDLLFTPLRSSQPLLSSHPPNPQNTQSTDGHDPVAAAADVEAVMALFRDGTLPLTCSPLTLEDTPVPSSISSSPSVSAASLPQKQQLARHLFPTLFPTTTPPHRPRKGIVLEVSESQYWGNHPHHAIRQSAREQQQPPQPSEQHDISLTSHPPPGMFRREKMVRVQDEVSHHNFFVFLRDSWYDTPVSTGDTLQLLYPPPFMPSTPSALPSTSHLADDASWSMQDIIVDDQHHLLAIINPERLISPTTISSHFMCKRRAILAEFSPSYGAAQADELLYGQLLHNIFQEALTTTVPLTAAFLESLIAEQIAAAAAKIFAAHRSRQQVHQWLAEFIDPILGIIQRLQGPATPSKPHLHAVHSIEENILCPALGLKGKIDVLAHCLDHRGVLALKPIELKSGKRKSHFGAGTPSHRAQLMLYTLLIHSKYSDAPASIPPLRPLKDITYQATLKPLQPPAKAATDAAVKDPPVDGLLCYMGSADATFRVESSREEIREIMQARNEIAKWLGRVFELDVPSLPPMLAYRPQLCTTCSSQPACLLYHAVYEGGTAQSVSTAGLSEAFAAAFETTEADQGIPAAHARYFEHWELLIRLETSTEYNQKLKLWNLPSAHVEKHLGRCLGDLRIVDHTLPKRFVFAKSHGNPLSPDADRTTAFHPGDFVLISCEQPRKVFGVSRGRVKSVTSHRIEITAHSPLKIPTALPSDDMESCLPPSMTITLGADGIDGVDESADLAPALRHALWRVDLDDSSVSFGVMRSNLTSFLTEPQHRRLRELLIELAPPRLAADPLCFHNNPDDNASASGFPPAAAARLAALSGADVPTLFAAAQPRILAAYETLNVDQQRAVDTALNANDYVLILGMPGTGKTSTMATLIGLLLLRGHTVLISSYTHSAVDTLLLKLLELGITEGIFRAAEASSVHPEIAPFTYPRGHHAGLASSRPAAPTVEQLEEAFAPESSPVVATTCLGVFHPIFSRRRFDYCILDEASQLSEPACLGPLLLAQQFILVGDHYQLPPLIVNKRSREEGMDVSLFKRLAAAHPQALVQLTFQYRMNADIQCIANSLVYNHRLRCGTEQVARMKLPIALDKLSQLPDWLWAAVHPDRPALFLNTDDIPGEETKASGDSRANPVEASVVLRILAPLLAAGLPAQEIGVISPYRAQVSLIKSQVAALSASGIEVETVDKFQGRDKQCIIISCVRANPRQQLGNILRDWRRLNVAITRAKTKLIFIGSVMTLQHDHFFKALFQLFQNTLLNGLIKIQ